MELLTGAKQIMTNEQKALELCIEYARLKKIILEKKWSDAQEYRETKIKIDDVEYEICKLGLEAKKAGE